VRICVVPVRLLYVVVCIFLSLPRSGFAQVLIQEELLEPVGFLYPYSIVNGQLEVGSGITNLVIITFPPVGNETDLTRSCESVEESHRLRGGVVYPRTV
jgi:hypothetical protein